VLREGQSALIEDARMAETISGPAFDQAGLLTGFSAVDSVVFARSGGICPFRRTAHAPQRAARFLRTATRRVPASEPVSTPVTLHR
jgi:hypothetical protein